MLVVRSSGLTKAWRKQGRLPGGGGWLRRGRGGQLEEPCWKGRVTGSNMASIIYSEISPEVSWRVWTPPRGRRSGSVWGEQRPGGVVPLGTWVGSRETACLSPALATPPLLTTQGHYSLPRPRTTPPLHPSSPGGLAETSAPPAPGEAGRTACGWRCPPLSSVSWLAGQRPPPGFAAGRCLCPGWRRWVCRSRAGSL